MFVLYVFHKKKNASQSAPRVANTEMLARFSVLRVKCCVTSVVLKSMHDSQVCVIPCLSVFSIKPTKYATIMRNVIVFSWSYRTRTYTGQANIGKNDFFFFFFVIAGGLGQVSADRSKRSNSDHFVVKKSRTYFTISIRNP